LAIGSPNYHEGSHAGGLSIARGNNAMLIIDKILLPVDFDFPDGSMRMGRQAAVLARHFHSSIVMLHVIVPPSALAYTLSGGYVPAHVLERARKDLDEFLRPELEGIDVKRVLVEGDAAQAIVGTAREEKAGLIMMPTHNYGAFERLLLGSVTAKVLHDRECPVWTGAHIEDGPAGELAIRNVLCAIDLSEHSRNTICWAAQIAKDFDAHLTLGHVTAAVEMFGPGGAYVLPDFKRELTQYATEEIAKLQREMGTHADVFIASGNVPKQLNLAAQQTNADVLVIGCRPANGRLRANAYSIVRESSVPVLSV
jgi:nucleotide-binding universal stress UspA family protein